MRLYSLPWRSGLRPREQRWQQVLEWSWLQSADLIVPPPLSP
ncbi:hypothetical protein [Cyanobium sp. HWJ4-Hawea]|nr:hypothetical protein [Cyanobium sp. HWJ4-Hawea]